MADEPEKAGKLAYVRYSEGRAEQMVHDGIGGTISRYFYERYVRQGVQRVKENAKHENNTKQNSAKKLPVSDDNQELPTGEAK
jgi:hypothetical protein